MEIRPSRRISDLPGYPFAQIDQMVSDLQAAGHHPIDFGVGDPTEPTPEIIRRAVQKGVDTRAQSGYPSYVGSPEYRQAIADFMDRRFSVKLNVATEICATIGSKEAVFQFPNCLIDPGDIVLCPSPGYPPYNRGTLFAGGVPYYYPVTQENDFLPDLEAIPEGVLQRARIIWVNYPNSPTGKVAPDEFWPRLLKFAQKYNLVVASDEAYSEVYFSAEPPRSALEFGRDGVIVFQSLSKRSYMTGHRVGWACGDERVISLFKKLKTNVDSGTATFIQDGAIVALKDEEHVAKMRQLYQRKREILVDALLEIGCELADCTGTLYLWPKAPKGMTGLEFAQKLLDPSIAVVCTPGVALGEKLADGSNPGEYHVRFALVPDLEQVIEASKRMKAAFGVI